MTEERKNLLIDALAEDKEFTKEIMTKGIPEMTAALNAKGYDFSESEITEMGEIFKKVANDCFGENGELNEDTLEAVVGGGKGRAIVGVILFVGLACAVGY